MSKHQELINESLKLANKGMYHKDAIDEVIKSDFLNQYHSADSLMALYKTLSTKYGKSVDVIMRICKK